MSNDISLILNILFRIREKKYNVKQPRHLITYFKTQAFVSVFMEVAVSLGEFSWCSPDVLG